MDSHVEKTCLKSPARNHLTLAYAKNEGAESGAVGLKPGNDLLQELLPHRPIRSTLIIQQEGKSDHMRPLVVHMCVLP